MSLCSWVNVVVGRMTGIDRAAKHVVVSKNEIVFYDHLILCTGQQYQVRLVHQGRGWRRRTWQYAYWGARSLSKERPVFPHSCHSIFIKVLFKACTHDQNGVCKPSQESHSKKNILSRGKKNHS